MTCNPWNRFRPRRGSMTRRRLSAVVTAAGWLFTVCGHAIRRPR